jgi:hypothetical protein
MGVTMRLAMVAEVAGGMEEHWAESQATGREIQDRNRRRRRSRWDRDIVEHRG